MLEQDLARVYQRRFANQSERRDRVWRILCADFFQKYIAADASVLDLGAGYGQFINNISAGSKFAMDLNPDARNFVHRDVTLFEQDCSQAWPLTTGSLGVIFTSNFLEHLPDKDAVRRTFAEARRCLSRGGTLICMGPNIRYLAGDYWDFWDHHVPLSDKSLRECLDLAGFETVRSIPRFLPYTMAGGRFIPSVLIRAYLRLPFAWAIFGRQFVVIASG